MKQINLFLFFSIIIFSLTRCDKENNTETPQVDELKNTTWLLVRGNNNCDAYYQFMDSTYTVLNPCYGQNDLLDEIILLAWEEGTYSYTENALTFYPKESCDNSVIGSTQSISYSFVQDTLVFVVEQYEMKLIKGETLPDFLDNNVEYGYWGADDYWHTSSSCVYVE